MFTNVKNKLTFKNLGLILVLLYILIRLPYLGFSNFNTDSFKWKVRIYGFGSGVFNLNLIETVQKYHPGVTLMWIGTLSVKFYNLFYESILNTPPLDNNIDFVFSLNFFQILFIVVFQSFLVFILFYFLSQIYDPIKSFLIILTLTLEPFFLGITTTLHLDGLLNLFLINFLVTFYLFLIKSDKFYLYTSAIFFGLALLTKTTALLFISVVLISLVLRYLIIEKLKYRLFLKNTFLFSLVTFFTYFIVWPGMWIDPIGTLKYVYEGVVVGTEDHSQIYFGNLVNDPGAFYYLIVTFIKATIYIFPALLVVAYTQLNTTYKKYTFEIFLFLSSILYLIEISIPSKKLDRYIYTFMILLSLIIYSYIYDISKKVLIYFISINLFFIMYLNYDYFSYYNPLFGGVKNGINWVEPKWIFGQKEVLGFFTQEKISNGFDDYLEEEPVAFLESNHNYLIVAIPEKYYTQLYPYFRLINSRLVIDSLAPEAKNAKYFIYPIWADTSQNQKIKYKLEYYNQITVRGVAIFNVYKNNK